jgi:GNAT superfamily N-acetyltransferase
MNFQKESFESYYKDAEKLLYLHWREVAHYQDIELNVDVDRYKAIENAGDLRTFTARNEEGRLLGYALFFVKRNLHYKDSLQAVQDVIFIDPERRGFGTVFIKWCDDQLRDEGVQAVYHHIKKAHNWSKILEQQDYELVDLIYAKRLDE